jgi:methionyl-tRNA synthetase
VVYVWIDALVNYLTGLGYGTDASWSGWWNEDVRKVHVIGRNVWKFHAIYWPALLLSAGLPLPDELVIHGFLTADGCKISKSLGNAISPEDYIGRYGADALRYFLLRAVPPFGDGDFSTHRFAAVYQADLANGLGNLVSRLLTLAEKSGLPSVALETTAIETPEFQLACAQYRYDEALAILWRGIDGLNREIEQTKPWAVLKEGKAAIVQSQVADWLRALGTIARHLGPFLPATSARILELLANQPLRAAPPLFPRV